MSHKIKKEHVRWTRKSSLTHRSGNIARNISDRVFNDALKYTFELDWSENSSTPLKSKSQSNIDATSPTKLLHRHHRSNSVHHKLVLGGNTHVDTQAWIKIIKSSKNLSKLDVYTKLNASHRYVIKEGFLEVVRQGPLIFETEINIPTYCVVFNDIILYFHICMDDDKITEFVVAGVIHLPSIQRIKSGNNKNFFAFSIITSSGGGGGDLYTCYANTEKQRELWILTLRNAVSQFKNILKVVHSNMDLTIDGINGQLRSIDHKLIEAEREAANIRHQLNELTGYWISVGDKLKKLKPYDNSQAEYSIAQLKKEKESIENDMQITLQKSLDSRSKVVELMAIQDDWNSILESLVHVIDN